MSRSEQGYVYRQHGLCDQILLDFEGLGLVTKLRREKKGGGKGANSADSGTSETT